jgi:broad specificity phosphatase PhoE
VETLILMRHAESVFNDRGVLNGNPNVPGGLTERGADQARRARALLGGQPLDLCVTTNFQRCVETADIVLERRSVPRAVMPELNDPPVGHLELRPYAELERWRAEHGPDAFVPGISTSEYFEAIRHGFSLLARRPERRILAVIHGEGVYWLLTSLSCDVPTQAQPVTLQAAAVRDVL